MECAGCEKKKGSCKGQTGLGGHIEGRENQCCVELPVGNSDDLRSF